MVNIGLITKVKLDLRLEGSEDLASIGRKYSRQGLSRTKALRQELPTALTHHQKHGWSPELGGKQGDSTVDGFRDLGAWRSREPDTSTSDGFFVMYLCFHLKSSSPGVSKLFLYWART